MFSENSTVSSMRVMAVLSLMNGMGIAIYGIYKGADLTGVAALSGVFVMAAFTGKVAQKVVEK